jgi:hypothetical protein
LYCCEKEVFLLTLLLRIYVNALDLNSLGSLGSGLDVVLDISNGSSNACCSEV